MHQGWGKNWKTVAVLATSAFLLGAGLYAGFLSLNKSVRISVDLRTNRPGTATLYYSLGNLPFEGARATRQVVAPHVTETLHLRWLGYQRITGLRIDPLKGQGKAHIERVGIETQWRSLSLTGQRLAEALGPVHNATVGAAGENGVAVQMQSHDPQLILRVPEAVYRPPTNVMVSHGAVAGIILALLVLLIDMCWRGPPNGRPWLPAGLRTRSLLQFSIAAMIVAILIIQASTRIGGPIYGDGAKNLQIVHNLYAHGVYSQSVSQPPSPDNRREPLPILVMTGHLALFASSLPDTRLETLQHGAGSRLMKLSNLYWIGLGLMATWLLAYGITGRPSVALAVTLVAFYFFFGEKRWINNLYTELQAASLIMAWAAAWVLTLKKRTLWMFALTGMMAGLLALTKSAFSYIMPVAWLVLAGVVFTRPPAGFNRKAIMAGMAVIVTVGAAVVSPWSLRNSLLLEDIDVSQRGGQILFGRALLNRMSADEIKGVYYLYGPSLYRDWIAGTEWDKQPGDLEKGGRWQRLNRRRSAFAQEDLEAQQAGDPSAAISFHRIAGAYVVADRTRARESGHPAPLNAADNRLKRRAIAWILEDPIAHLKVTLPTFWRGLWSMPLIELPGLMHNTQQRAIELLNLSGFAALLATGLFALLQRRARLLGAVLPALGLIAFYALFTHNIPRYYAPVHPLMLVLAGLILHHVVRSSGRRVAALFGLSSRRWHPG
jgi:hypothetical protein